MELLVPGISGFLGVLVMTFFIRRARFFHLPETQMIRAIGSMITRDSANALWPGFVAHTIAGIIFAYVYWVFLETAPVETGFPHAVLVVVCTMMGFVHGLIVTLILVISVSQYHPLPEFRKLEPGDMAAHVIGHIAYGLTVGLGLAWLPELFGV
ncbi:MAG: hypothetical protein QNK37_34440 [Acidobacteriota bacterium]|nr:hypothetical protein [Acidobacteriota bacterium]